MRCSPIAAVSSHHWSDHRQPVVASIGPPTTEKHLVLPLSRRSLQLCVPPYGREYLSGVDPLPAIALAPGIMALESMTPSEHDHGL